MKTITLSRQSTHVTPGTKLTSYRLVLEVTATNGITKEIFVKQRFRDILSSDVSTFTDVFAAVATPVQMEDLAVGSPDASTSYFRVALVDLVFNTSDRLEEVYQLIIADIQMLLGDSDALEVLETDGSFVVTAESVT